MAYPSELLQAEEQFDQSLQTFARDLRAAAAEIDRNHLEQVQRLGAIVAMAGNILEKVRQALFTAVSTTDALTKLVSEVRRGADNARVRDTGEYQAAATALNAVEDEIRAAQREEESRRAMAQALMNYGKKPGD